MIAFLVITTVINIALGYALAVYLGGGSSAAAEEAYGFARAEPKGINAVPPASERVVAESLATALSVAAAQSISIPQPSQAADSVVAASQAEQEPEEATEQFFRTAEMEQNLLAGIEEFRNQLAQLKTQGFDEGIPELAATGD